MLWLWLWHFCMFRVQVVTSVFFDTDAFKHIYAAAVSEVWITGFSSWIDWPVHLHGCQPVEIRCKRKQEEALRSRWNCACCDQFCCLKKKKFVVEIFWFSGNLEESVIVKPLWWASLLDYSLLDSNSSLLA